EAPKPPALSCGPAKKRGFLLADPWLIELELDHIEACGILVPCLPPQGIHQRPLVPVHDLVRQIRDHLGDRLLRTERLHDDHGLVARLRVKQLECQQVLVFLEQARQAHHHLDRGDLLPQALAQRLPVTGRRVVRSAEITVEEIPRALEVFEHAQVVIGVLPHVRDEEADWVGLRHCENLQLPPVSHKPGRRETSPHGDTRGRRTATLPRARRHDRMWFLGRGPLHLRLLVYNIRYATGTGPAFHLPVPGAGYLRSNRKVLTGITEFIRAEHPAGQLGHYSTYQCKYGTGSINNLMPIVRKQGNAFLSAPHVHGERFHYFDTGIKRLIIELELEDVCVFLVHLSLKFRHRQYQLRSLHDLIVQSHKPVIVAGDFNTFWGAHEIYLFMRAAGLRSANSAGLPSFPARVPRAELDFILVSEGIEVTDFRIPDVRFSDHRPLVCDFHVGAGESARRSAA